MNRGLQILRLSASFTSSQKISKISRHFSVTMAQRNQLLGLGNPLLDITVCTDTDFLDQYGLEANNAIIAKSHKHKIVLFEDMQKEFRHPIYGAGGATQNAIRVAQWLLRSPKATSFIGCVGNDEQGKLLKEAADRDGVHVKYCIDEEHSTGVCGSIITGEDRSLIAHLGAAEYLCTDWLTHDDNWKLVTEARAYYMAAFLFETCPNAIHAVLDHAVRNNKLVAMNLSSPALCRFFADEDSASDTVDILSHVDILFGNGVEAMELCRRLNIDTDNHKQMALDIVNLKKKNNSRKRIVVFTRGSKSTIVADGNSMQVKEYDIKPVLSGQVKDTNGCGDAFVGGFLSQRIQMKSLDDCVYCGHYAAHTILQYWGCNYPDKPDF